VASDNPAMAGKIFVNYRRDDSAPHALNVAQYLENTFGKRNIFIDIDRLRAGQEFETVLENKLRQCKVMLAIIGPNWVDARDGGSRRIDNPEDWVRLEIERALARKIPVIPVLVAGATLPSKSDLPPSLQPLLKHQCATVTTNGLRIDHGEDVHVGAAALTQDLPSCLCGDEYLHERVRRTADASIMKTPLLSYNPNTNSMVWLRISRSSGVFTSVVLAGRLSPVRIATYCLPPTSKVMGGALMPTPTLTCQS